jgi:hypothetical protein
MPRSHLVSWLPRRKRAMSRDSVSISIKPTVTVPKHPIESWQTEDCIEGPCPPDLPCHIEVGVSTRFHLSGPSQHSYVVQQILLRDLQASIGKSGLQVFKRKATRFEYFRPQVNPTIAEPASPVVKYPAFASERALRFLVGQSHILVPAKTMTGEPSATNAESGRR